jgi:hypothetical protein
VNRLMIGIVCLLALLVNGWIATTIWVQARIEREVSYAVSTLRSELVLAAHGPVAVNLWDRSVVIPNIVLRPRGADGAVLTIGSLTAFDVSKSDGVLSARRIAITDLLASGPLPSNPATRGHVLVPGAWIDGVSWQLDTSPTTGFSAQSVSVPDIRSSTILQSKTIIEQTHRDITVRSVRKGKIGTVDIGQSAITASMFGENPVLVEIIDASLADIDIGLMAGLFEETALKPSDADRYKTVLRYGSTGAMTVYREGAVAATCASLELSNLAIDASRSGTAVRVLKEAQPTAGQRLSRKQEQAMQDAVVTLYENVATDWLKINGLTWAPGTLPVGRGQGSIATLQMHNLIDGKLARLLITGLDAITFPDTPTFSPAHDSLVVGRSAFHNLNLVELTRLPARLVTSSMKLPSTAILWPLAVRLFDGIDAEKVFVTTGLQRDGIGIDQLSAAWGPVIGQTPTSGQLRTTLSIPVDESPAPTSWLSRAGLGRANISLDGQWEWREATKTLAFGPVNMSVAGIGSASATLQLTNVTRMALIARPDLMPAAIQAITLGPIDMTVRDQGLLMLLGKDPRFPVQRQRTVSQYQMLVGGTGDNRLSVKATETAATPPWASVADFLAQPGQRLTLTITPTASVSLGSLLLSGKSGDDLIRQLATQIDARAIVK